MGNTVKSLEVTNLGGIDSIKITPSKGVTIISGGTGAGKSTLANAVGNALMLKGKHPEVIKDNDGRATIILETDEFTVERRITQTGNTVDVKIGDMKVTSPQAWLTDKIGTGLNFNPIAFFGAKPNEQRDILLAAIPLNITQEDGVAAFGDDFASIDYSRHAIDVLEEIETIAYSNRQSANGEVKAHQQHIDTYKQSFPSNFDAKVAETVRSQDIGDLYSQIANAENIEREQQRLLNELSNHSNRLENLNDKSASLLQQLEQVNTDIARTEEAIQNTSAAIGEISIPNVEEAKAAIENHTKSQEYLRAFDQMISETKELEEVQVKASRLDEIVKMARSMPSELISNAEIPIPNLTFDGTFKYEGKDISVLSDGEKLEFAITIAKALNSEIKIICVDGAEKLDPERFNALKEMAQQDEYQYIITRVTEGPLTVTTDDES